LNRRAGQRHAATDLAKTRYRETSRHFTSNRHATNDRHKMSTQVLVSTTRHACDSELIPGNRTILDDKVAPHDKVSCPANVMVCYRKRKAVPWWPWEDGSTCY